MFLIFNKPNKGTSISNSIKLFLNSIGASIFIKSKTTVILSNFKKSVMTDAPSVIILK